MPIKLVRWVNTCEAVPSQWDAWDAKGNYYYLRFRYNRATLETAPGPNSLLKDWKLLNAMRDPKATGEPFEGYCTFEEICEWLGVEHI